VFTERYALSPYMKQIRFVFKGLRPCGHIPPLTARLHALVFNSDHNKN
jgi:hypothetical protein